ncbi:phosphoenolpyruvate--protein phosphotransferase [Proteiniclasticum sp. BAD-10]|uniref:Phosphoenolpyruvate-protein phosphotransferase n=1 Tax=Proteiniclasticum sediminis TaxID=2804028 RepID=A0A941CSK3_9CLOT|nr:phosphoenolpyruvate--protein phosphotransferase [Proteiniclasticum sediminis]MBR0576968.1 phosphoenolpyruvate--protein phosphotransferase [Proteiniclasticum sediminis]
MKIGIPASRGYAIGQAYIKKHVELHITSDTPKDLLAEKELLHKAAEQSKKQLEKVRKKALESMGEEKAMVFDAHLMLFDDPEFIGAIASEIEGGKNALKATQDIMDSYVAIFESMDDEYMRERAADIKDVAKRLMNNLAGIDDSFNIEDTNTIVIAHDLTPSDTAQLDRSKVIAFLTNIGGRTSHSAIMARTLEIPAVVGLGDITETVSNGDILIVDGIEGKVIVDPDHETVTKYVLLQEAYNKEKEELKKLVDTEARTKSGKRIDVAGNIGKPEDVHKVIENGADGIGLFRTEFLYMDREEMPTEDEQFESYKYVLDKMEGKPVVIRTLDIGGDKQLPYLVMPNEMNPFLGYRAIRLCLDRTDLFKIQLRALLRASVYGNLKVMFPMVSSLDEFLKSKELVEECTQELLAEGHKVSESIEWGIMVEIPSAAVMADELAKYVDFFSIGTNDLIQYTLAADRMSEKVSYLYNPMHPAVLRLIKMTIDGAHSQGKWCGMCGEMAGDETAIATLVAYGLDEFSMSASSILRAKQIILEQE